MPNIIWTSCLRSWSSVAERLPQTEPMTIQKCTKELACLRILLGKLRAGTTSHFDEHEKAQLTRETTGENVEQIRLRIAELESTGNDNPQNAPQ